MNRRNSTLLLVGALVAAMAWACSHDTKEIEQAAYHYLDAVSNYRFDEAAPYASQQTVEVTLDFYTHLLPHIDPDFLSSSTPATVSITQVKLLTDSTATAHYHKATPLDENDEQLSMVKENGKWVADFVIVIPDVLSPDSTNVHRTFTREQIRELRRNGPQTVSHLNR